MATVSSPEWRKIDVVEGDYSVSSNGEVRNNRTTKILKPQRTGRIGAQYLAVFLRRLGDNGFKAFNVHILVAHCFIGPKPEGMCVLHKNDVREDCRADNLYYGTQKQNTHDAVRNDCNPYKKLSYDQSVEIKARRLRGEQGNSLAAEFQVSPQTVCDISKGRRIV